MLSGVRNMRIGVLAGLLVVALALPALAAPAAGDGELRRLVLENALAKQIAELNLTPAQKQELKEALAQVRAAREGLEAQLVPLLERRRDALLSGDKEAAQAAEKELRELVKGVHRTARESLAEFTKGLTERQAVALRRLLAPGLWLEGRGPMPAPVIRHRFMGPGGPMGDRLPQMMERFMDRMERMAPMRPDGERRSLRERFDRREARPGTAQGMREHYFSGRGPGLHPHAGMLGERLDLIIELLDRSAN